MGRVRRFSSLFTGWPVLAAVCVVGVIVVDAMPASTASAEPYARGILFRVNKPGIAASYVFGTVHSADPRVTTLAKPVLDAFSSARTLALENHLGDGDVAALFEAAQFDDGRRLTDFFDSSAVEAIRHALGAGAPSDAVFLRLKPWAVLLRLGEVPTDGGETLDQRLLAEAKRRRLGIVGLELPDEQIAAFDAIPLATQVALVQFVLAHRGALVRDHDAVIAAWLARDLARLAALNAAVGRKYPAMAPHFAALTLHLVENRSAQMAHRLFLPLRAGRVFVAVGALHLYGPRGLPALLREQGYRVNVVY